MVNPNAIEQSRQGKRRAMDAIYGYLVLHQPKLTTDGDLADRLRVPKQDLRNLRYDLVETGSLRTTRKGDGKSLKMEWLLLDDIETARTKLTELWKDQDRQTEQRVAQMGKDNADRFQGKTRDEIRAGAHANGHDQASVLVAVSGPDGDKPFTPLGKERWDEPRAIVEAGRQYAGLHKQVDSKIKELQELGIEIDRDKIAKGMRLPSDPRLDGIANAMPYIEGLERQVERLTQQNTDLREKNAGRDDLIAQVTRLRNANERLVGENTALRNELSNRGQVAPKGPAPVAAGR